MLGLVVVCLVREFGSGGTSWFGEAVKVQNRCGREWPAGVWGAVKKNARRNFCVALSFF